MLHLDFVFLTSKTSQDYQANHHTNAHFYIHAVLLIHSQFFTNDEGVMGTDPEKYLQKSLYYLNNVKEQEPYIEKVQKKIKTKYNWYIQWQNILETVITKQSENDNDEYEHYTRINQLLNEETPFFTI